MPRYKSIFFLFAFNSVLKYNYVAYAHLFYLEQCLQPANIIILKQIYKSYFYNFLHCLRT